MGGRVRGCDSVLGGVIAMVLDGRYSVGGEWAGVGWLCVVVGFGWLVSLGVVGFWGDGCVLPRWGEI